MAAAPRPDELINRIHVDLVHNDPMQDVGQCLQACQTALTAWHQTQPGPTQMTVYPKPAAYSKADQRVQAFALYRERNPHLATMYTEEEWREEEQAFGIIGDAVHGANQRCYVIYGVEFQNLVFSHSWNVKHFGMADTPANRAKFYKRDNMWYEFVVVLHQRTVYVYNPSYAPQPASAPKRQLKELPMCGNKASAIANALRTRKLKVEKVLVGGGENMGEDFRKLSLGWVQGLVEALVLGLGYAFMEERVWEEVKL